MNKVNQDLVILVDENDAELGTMPKLEAHKKAVLHRAISVFICNSQGHWLLQRRAFSKYHSNGLWSNACCSHPHPGETNMDAAHRRLMEEMGLKAPLKKLFHFTYMANLDNELTEHEFDHVFLGITDGEPVLNTEEVEEWKYITHVQLLDEVNNNPEQFTVWFREVYQRVNRHVNDSVSAEKL